MDDWDGLDAAFAELEAECTEAVRGLTVYVWNGVLAKTPQFYGRMVASWSYSIGAPEYVDRSAAVDFVGPRRTQIGAFEPSQGLYRGHPAAIAIANQASAGRDRAFKLGDHVYISNGADHGEGPYAEEKEQGIRLRAVNQPGRMLGRTLDQVQSSFGDDITRQRAASLTAMTIGS